MSKSRYIVGPTFDAVLFIGSPLLALGLGLVIGQQDPQWIWRATIFMGIFGLAHSGLVLVRSHFNTEIFKRFPYRFTVVPLVLFAACALSPTVLVVVLIVTTWWDVYHSSLQTFGLGRLYDARAGNDVHAGRAWDIAFTLVTYAGPILAGASLTLHLKDFKQLAGTPLDAWTAIPATVTASQRAWSTPLWILGAVFVLVYIARTIVAARRGQAPSWQKTLLLVNTAACSVWVWGYNPFGQALFIMNFFHALQYFAIVWWSESPRLYRRWQLDPGVFGTALTLAALVIPAMAFGLAATAAKHGWLRAAVVTIATMHFWYDGFIWSVRRGDV